MLIFKGIDLKNMGIITETLPKIQKGKKKIDLYEIHGRDGVLTVDNGTYESWNLQIGCHCKDNVNLDQLSNYLDGYGTISFDGVKQSTAIVNNSIPFEKIRSSGFKKFMLSFQINPIFEDIEATESGELANEFVPVDDYQQLTYQIDSLNKVYPILEIEISNETTFNFNDKTFTLKAGHYFLDCKNKLIVDEDGDNMSGKMSGNFPYLLTNNTIETNNSLDSFKITYKNTYLVG